MHMAVTRDTEDRTWSLSSPQERRLCSYGCSGEGLMEEVAFVLQDEVGDGVVGWEFLTGNVGCQAFSGSKEQCSVVGHWKMGV